jgi:hypothetical protein
MRDKTCSTVKRESLCKEHERRDISDRDVKPNEA